MSAKVSKWSRGQHSRALEQRFKNGAVESLERSQWRLVRLKMNQWVADLHHFDEDQDPDPHQSEKLDPEPGSASK